MKSFSLSIPLERHCVGLGGNGIFTSIPHQCMGFPEYEDVCVVACLLPGYQLHGPGSAEFQCMQNGTWDQALDDFNCLGKQKMKNMFEKRYRNVK